MLIVQSPEHVLHEQHELVLCEAGHARREFGLERVPVDALVLEIRVVQVERRPHLLELCGDVGGSGSSRRSRLTTVALTCCCCHERRSREQPPGAGSSLSRKTPCLLVGFVLATSSDPRVPA
jgi:hypothetical protein